MMRNVLFQKVRALPALLVSLALLMTGCTHTGVTSGSLETQTTAGTTAAAAEMPAMGAGTIDDRPTLADYTEALMSWNYEDTIPGYDGEAWSVVNDNVPYFADNEKVPAVFENYSELDELGRCGQAYALICQELMPTEERGEIGQVKPSGWHTAKYPDLISDLYLYNRCHLIGFQLAGENANERNLITGTRYLNITGMLPFENEVADHVHDTGHHVLYRVTPIFIGNELVCRGVEMEGFCVEDNGVSNDGGVSFHVFAYNIQPGIEIDYATGESWVADGAKTEAAEETTAEADPEAREYALNINSMKFHYPDCKSVSQANPKNIKYWTCTRQELIEDGYSPCGVCNP